MITRGQGWAEREISQDGDVIGWLDYDEPGDGEPFIDMSDWAGCIKAPKLREIADFLDSVRTGS